MPFLRWGGYWGHVDAVRSSIEAGGGFVGGHRRQEGVDGKVDRNGRGEGLNLQRETAFEASVEARIAEI